MRSQGSCYLNEVRVRTIAQKLYELSETIGSYCKKIASIESSISKIRLMKRNSDMMELAMNDLQKAKKGLERNEKFRDQLRFRLASGETLQDSLKR